MDYLWRNPMELKDERLEDLLGKDFGTPFREAVAKTVRPFFAMKPSQAPATTLTQAKTA